MIDLTAAFRAVVAALEGVGADYVVVGSTAAAAWGVARTTRDVDMVTVLKRDELEGVLKQLARAGLYVPADEAREAATAAGSFNVIDPASGGKVDLFVADPDDAFTRSRFRRRVRAEVLGIPAWVSTVEDVLLAKLRWRLESRSEVQWRDCVEMASANDLDLGYLRHWAPALGVGPDLEELLDATDPDP